MTWGTPVRAAAYIRVSSKTQTFATQKAAIIQAATARGDTIGHFYEEKRSGNSLDRPKLAELQGDAQAGKVVKLYVFRIDRLTRRGIRDTLAIVEDFQRHGVTLVTVADGFDFGGANGGRNPGCDGVGCPNGAPGPRRANQRGTRARRSRRRPLGSTPAARPGHARPRSENAR